MYFQYGQKEINYLTKQDVTLGQMIEQYGYVKRVVNHDIFSSLIYFMVGQQISTKAHQTIWKRMIEEMGIITPNTILQYGKDKIQSFGMTFKKAEYIIECANKVKNNEIDIYHYSDKSDEMIIKELTSLRGVGLWSAEMILLHCLERPNVFSFGDIAIKRGLKMLYGHENIDRTLFETYRRRFSPYCSVASIYLWALASQKGR